MVFSQVNINIRDGRKEIVKKYNGFNSSKWWLSRLLHPFYPFASSSKSRLERELNFLRSENKLKKPEVYSFNMDEREIRRQFIEGKNDYCSGGGIGKLLSEVHKEGYVLGDSKLDNFICNSDSVYIIDAEQAIHADKNRYRYWDVSLLLLSAGYYNYSNIEGFKSFIDGFSREYAYWKGYRERVLKGPYSLLFLLMPVQHVAALRKALLDR